MGETTGISWTDATFNPVWGCVEVSPACTNCYAREFATRTGHGKRLPQIWGPAPNTDRRVFGEKHWSQLLAWNAAAAKAGIRKRVFVGSMCDWAENHPTTAREVEKLWPMVRQCTSLDFLMLTKRPERIASVICDGAIAMAERWIGEYDTAAMLARWFVDEPPPNVWLGTTCEDQRRLDERGPVLLDIPAAVHFFSCEPLLECISLKDCAPDWLIVGGESGPHARPFDLTWLNLLLDECHSNQITVPFVKQLGSRPVVGDKSFADYFERDPLKDRHGADPLEWPAALRIQQFPGVRHG